jgi:hypothetical protein
MLQWCYIGVTVVLQLCYSGVIVVFPSPGSVALQHPIGRPKMELKWCDSGVTVVL